MPDGNVTVSFQYSAVVIVSGAMPNTSGRLDFQIAKVSRFITQPLGKLLGGITTAFVAG